ncbi:MAG: SRPBCC family protein [Rhizobiaceae bacterium]|nr:SRPBCC family protein [Rhizobiaceae bacterium]
MPARTGAELGRIVAPQTVRVERFLPAPPDRVWQYLTESGLRRRWLAGGLMEPQAGGKVEHLFRHAELSAEPNPPRYAGFADSPAMPGKVTVWEPPQRLAYSWPGDGGVSEVVFELSPDGAGTRLVLTHVRLADRDTMVSVASGWGAHLGILDDVLAGRPPRGFWSEHARLEALHEAAFAPAADTARETSP